MKIILMLSHVELEEYLFLIIDTYINLQKGILFWELKNAWSQIFQSMQL